MTLDPSSPQAAVPRSAAPSVSALEALQGLGIAAPHRLTQARLSRVVAATLRAAIDMITGEEATRRPLAVTFDDGSLEVSFPEFRADALIAAGSLIETVEGTLAPAERQSGLRIRVPVAAPRAFYLMLEQGTLAIAIPWHAVLRVRLASAEALATAARIEGCALLPPFVTIAPLAGERPVVLVGFGLRRAFLSADRLVWRMPADPVEVSDPPPDPELLRAVRTSEGDVYWAVDPARLLRNVEPPAPRAPAPAPSRLRSPVRPAPPPKPAPADPRLRLVELRREDVEPIGDPAPPPPHLEAKAPVSTLAPPAEAAAPSSEASAPSSSAPAAAPGSTEPSTVVAPPASAVRRVLIVEDSIVGRIFLQRMLETLGFEVEAVGGARDLAPVLEKGPWDAVFVDVDLPDSPGAEHLAARPGGSNPPRVALVRDRQDERIATAAGIPLHLRKPFETAELKRVLRALNFREPDR